MLHEVWEFLKHPKYEPFQDLETGEGKKYFFGLLKWSLVLCIGVSIVIGQLEYILDLDVGQHAIERLFLENSVGYVLILGGFLAPLLEELLFRGPLIWFKNSTYFKYFFYVSIILFGAAHISNFDLAKSVIWFAPLFVSPQIIMGVFLGFIRVKMGLLYSMLLHGAFNFTLITPFILLKIIGFEI